MIKEAMLAAAKYHNLTNKSIVTSLSKLYDKLHKDFFITSPLFSKIKMNCYHKTQFIAEKVLKDIEDANALVQKRISMFNEEAYEVGLDIYPVTGGFFACVNCENGHKLAEVLKEEEKIYVLPFDKVVRIALCAIPCSEIKGLAKRIKKCIDKSIA